jgi:hypothetical protein
MEIDGLVDLNLLHDFMMGTETWDTVCDYIETHPNIQVLNHFWPIPMETFASQAPLAPFAPAVLESRIEALNVNTLIHTIYLDSCHT